MLRAVAFSLALWSLVTAAAAAPRAYVVDPARSRIRFHAVSRFMDADGTLSRVTGEAQLEADRPETATGQATVEVASIDTGIGMRDDHLRSEDFLDAARHPRATLVVTRVRAEGGRLTVTGDLTLRGVTRPVSVPVTVTLAEASIRIVGDFTLNRRDFGIAYQSRLNPIRDEVKVSIDLVLVPR